jgi:hypothetical protein
MVILENIFEAWVIKACIQDDKYIYASDVANKQKERLLLLLYRFGQFG